MNGMKKTIVIIGGGAAGFFCALAAKRELPNADVHILESSAKVLSKVRISGGGRCNVTHSCFDPRNLVQHYPRGSKELLGPFHTFQPQDTVDWFRERGVELKTEEDGRMFPVTDSSETIIECFLQEAKSLGVTVHTRAKVSKLLKKEEGFEVHCSEIRLDADALVLASGSHPSGLEFAVEFGHTIVPPVPSLFTLNIKKFPLVSLAGVAHRAEVSLPGTKFSQKGPLLITHWGFSGPAALRLSAFGARYLAEKDYRTPVWIDWLPEMHEGKVLYRFEREQESHPKKHLGNLRMEALPKSLWKEIASRIADLCTPLCEISKAKLRDLTQYLKKDEYLIEGKTTNKEEFVTAGGVRLSEVHFKTMESRLTPGLYFCGEILDIDGVTGGFNFQNAWTTGWVVAKGLTKRFLSETQ
jgi:predicted Rossmann fold flavoprotein